MKFKKIIKITKSILREKSKKEKKGKGRPKEYPDYLIISIFLYQILKGYSYREVLEETKDIIQKLPSLSVYHYRVKTLPKSLLQKVIHKTAIIIIKKIKKKASYFIADGTGFSFDDIYPLKYLRGLEIRKVQNHIRIVPNKYSYRR
ncbi:hypothetical protein [Hydrogenothermus marinus]|nr:hypothetical protein [Hydrogenothermus marinus]